MAKGNNNNNQMSMEYMTKLIESSNNYNSFIGVDFVKIFNTITKEGLKSVDAIKKRAQELAEAQLKAEDIRFGKIQKNVEKQAFLEAQMAKVKEQRDTADIKHWDEIEAKRVEIENKISALKKQQHDYELKWQNKLDETIKGKKTKSDIKRERVEEYTRKFNNAVESGNEREAEFYLNNIKEQQKGIERQERLIKIADTIKSDVKALSGAVQNSLNNLYAEQIRFNARTTSADDAYGNMLKDISSLIGASPFIKQSDVIQNLNEIASTGSNYNIEQRAYLATLAKDISSTFDIKGEELLRLNRLLRTDMSSVMMGMEQNLTSALNSTFNDSSFMNNLRDAVASGVMDAQSQLSSGQGTDFAWAVQTWMGALTSAGVSSDVITMLTQGLNYLGSGNVSAMSGNESLQTLFALAASNAGGKSYSEMLVDGIDASDVNRLMSEMISYLKDISNENKVVQSEYFRILGMGGLSNMTALNNIDVNEVMHIAQNTRTNINTGYYDTASLLTMFNNAKDNMITSMASTLGESMPLLTAWLTADLLDTVVGGGQLPSAFAFGTGIQLPSIADTIRSISLLGPALNAVGGIATAFKNRGIADFGAFQEQAGGITSGFGTSLSYAVGSSSSGDMTKSSITAQAKNAMSNKKLIADATGQKEDEAQPVKDIAVLSVMNKMMDKFNDDISPIKVESKDLSKLADALSPDKVHKVSGTVSLAGFDGSSERTLNDVLVSAISSALGAVLGGASYGSGDMYMSSGYGNPTLTDYLGRIVETNESAMYQISDSLNYLSNQQDNTYIR